MKVWNTARDEIQFVREDAWTLPCRTCRGTSSQQYPAHDQHPGKPDAGRDKSGIGAVRCPDSARGPRGAAEQNKHDSCDARCEERVRDQAAPPEPERVPDPNVAALWYQRAIRYLPNYIKARVHLAEIYASHGQAGEAEALLVAALSSRDPEVRWRLADVLTAQDRVEEAKTQLDAARFGFEELLAKYMLAFADHAAEFYAGSGKDKQRALVLALANVANRPTRRALKQARTIAMNVGEKAP
jgi:hypothetical protein